MAAKKGKMKLPTKRSMNLYVNEADAGAKSRVAKLIVIALLVILVVFGVLGRYALLLWDKHKLSSEKEQLTQMETQLAGYDVIKEEYDKYTRGFMTGEESALELRQRFIKVATDAVDGYGQVYSIAVAGNMASIVIDVNNLNDVAQIRRNLRANPNVVDVTVYNADTATSKNEDGAIKKAVTTINFTMGTEINVEG